MQLCARDDGDDTIISVGIAAPNKVRQAGIESLMGRSHNDIRVTNRLLSDADLAGVLEISDFEIMLVDATMHEATLELLRFLRESPSSTRPGIIVIITDSPDPAVLSNLVSVGVDGILTIKDDIGDYIRALRCQRRTHCSISPVIGAGILDQTHQPGQQVPQQQLSQPVTDAEKRVMHLVAAGHTDRQIGKILNRSERAVKYHVGNLLSKFEARNRAHLVYLAMSAPTLLSDEQKAAAASVLPGTA